MKHAKAKAPGKLYIAGEYAVVTPGHPAVIIAVDRFISVSLSPSKEYFGKIFSSSISENTLIWKRQNQQIILEAPNKKADIILKTLELTEHFLKEHNILLPYY
ncbi:MAG: phosphomevalonate kinase, partial [Alkalibacterium sp.]|nr:phosphomevalonate kinase [Alkalibacterium sp.]